MPMKLTTAIASTVPARRTLAAAAVLGVIGAYVAIALFAAPSHAEGAIRLPAPQLDEPTSTASPEVAVFAGGCFWGVQGVFQHVDGVLNAVSGYAGGERGSAHYETVSSGTTGHAESVQVTFDPKKVTYGHLLQIFFSVIHDPTELNFQGPDTGTQYRSAIFPVDQAQAKIAKAYMDQLGAAHLFRAAIVTRIENGKTFYPAESYHQNFLTLNPNYPYIVFNDLPKVSALQALFAQDYRSEPVLVAAEKEQNPKAQRVPTPN